jgi:hypothetical protein
MITLYKKRRFDEHNERNTHSGESENTVTIVAFVA